MVSIHAPVWGATRNDNILYQLDAGFQSTLPYGERRPPITFLYDYYRFNPRSRMGSDAPLETALLSLVGFNPRSRMGSDGLSDARNPADRVVSIHAPVWGATRLDLKPAMKEYMFQSTLPYGERHITEIFHKSVDYVSIHAPVWGATAMDW